MAQLFSLGGLSVFGGELSQNFIASRLDSLVATTSGERFWWLGCFRGADFWLALGRASDDFRAVDWRDLIHGYLFGITMQPPNKSPEPTAVGAVRSAVAVHAASGRWLVR